MKIGKRQTIVDSIIMTRLLLFFIIFSLEEKKDTVFTVSFNGITNCKLDTLKQSASYKQSAARKSDPKTVWSQGCNDAEMDK
jgi:hypothetical protein